MKKIKLTLIISAVTVFSAKAQHNLSISISNINTAKGNMEIGLFNSEKGFLKDGAQYLKKKVKIVGNTLNYTFRNLPKGNYAIAVYHDENMNSKCDTNFMGIPTEGFGFSNNFRPKLSAPTFAQTKFSVNGDKSVSIKLIQ